VAGALTFIAAETGLESAAGVWGYLFLTVGRGLPPAAAGVAISAYWATMCAGRVILGPVAAPVFPLLTLTTGTSRMVGLQVAASAGGRAALPAALGLVISAVGARVLGPSLLALGLAMAALFLIRRPGRAASPVSP
jgi:hypothetical protein